MPYEPRPGSFSLFKADKKGNEKAPDYRGDGMDLSGNRIEVAAWVKEGKKGKFMSCSIKIKDYGSGQAAPKTREEPEDSPPF